MFEVLWISKTVPYDSVPHAGGKIENYYIKELNKHENLHIHLISFCSFDVVEKIDLDKYKIDNDIIVRKKRTVRDIFYKIINQETKFNPWNRYAGFTYNSEEISVLHKAKKLKKRGYSPNVIIFQWTQMVLLLPQLKEIFPKAKIISVEEDVSYLGLKRKVDIEMDETKKERLKEKYIKLKKLELQALNNSDLVILNNPKDEKLIKKDGVVSRTFVWSPYFQSMIKSPYIGDKNDIVFYGAMSRPENWKSAIWFIENVMPLLDDEQYRFVIVGNKPAKQLQKYASDKVVLLGFVEDISTVLSHAKCLVAPLLLGAGVKIKIIEGLSAGIPVITNKIGIEGIPAKKDFEYFECSKPIEYAKCISTLLHNINKVNFVSQNSKIFIEKNYNYEKDAERFYKIIIELLEEE